AVVESIHLGSLSPSRLLFLIGWGETGLGLGVLSGRLGRPLGWIQGASLVLMNVLGVVWGGPASADPFGLVIHNLPFLLCIVVLGVYGPGFRAPKRALEPP